jgi:membrane-bound lytic murein transglycosylase A
VTSYGDKTGKITGYYEAELKGSRHKIKASQVPIYGNPYGYKYGDTVKTRKKIEADKDFDAPIIAWADDPVDLFILHIQGSGRLITPGGEEIKLGYSGNNGQPFKGIGAIMADEGIPGEYRKSMGAIRKYLKAHPVKARELMAQNPRYIFFKEKPGQSPYGAAGVVLTPYRSIAVDPDFIPMHTPVWLSTSDPDGVPLTRLVMAQDKGTAIKGGIRADFFFGHGETAFDKAGRMHKSGGYYLLLPK